MATLVFQAAGAAIGSVFGPFGAILGRAAGALAGNALDQRLLSGTRTITGPRLSAARIPGAEEGGTINRVYGTTRIGGTLIWATRFEEAVTVERSGGKGSGGAKTETFRYFANFAIGLCEGEIASIRRVWADGQELDLTGIEMRIYTGTQSQQPDPLIEAKQGAGNAPAYRGLAYAVFERLPLDNYGNRIPMLQFEVLRPVGKLEKQIRAITVIPGSTEHGYATVQVSEDAGAGASRILNRNSKMAQTDWQASIDELMALCPNLERVALVVAWFGTDLRAGQCRILPGVEVSTRSRESQPWSVAGINRTSAYRVSQHDGGPAYGGTPSDASVRQAIADLKARGLKVCLYPFIMMDVPHGNRLPDPYGEAAQQPYPWRGRITCHPAPGRSGSPDRTATARSEINTFTNRADGYRRMVLHYANLAKAAGGVDAFLIGSELRGLTTLRDNTNAFPFVQELGRLAGDVRAIMGAQTKLTYGADWSEYFGYHPQDGSGDVFFHLDALWANPAIDAVGIDNYMPLSDWRDSDMVHGNPDGFKSSDDAAGFKGAITSGEGMDWYYASEADRLSRKRTVISDGLAAKPWVFRYKDLQGWWSNRHYNRIGGAESSNPTGWQPNSKPFWFTELGCPAVDKGANRPNVFADPKSGENAFPYYSSRTRSDLQQRRFLEAHHDWWQSNDAPAGMVDPSHIYLWTWDARPYPAFPQKTSIWSDGDNWRTGHWLNGRLGAATLADTIAAILEDHGFTDFDVSGVSGDLVGYVQGNLTSARNVLEPLLTAFLVDVLEDGSVLRFRSRTTSALPPKSIDTMADLEDQPLWSEARGHDADFAAEVVMTSFNPVLDYEQASVRSRRVQQTGNRIISHELNAAMSEETALGAAETLLRDGRLSRRTVSFALPPQEVGLEIGDNVNFPNGPQGRFIINRIEDGDVRRVEVREYAMGGTMPLSGEGAGKENDDEASSGFSPDIVLMDLPYFESGSAGGFARVAAFARPWRRMVLSASASTEGYQTRSLIEQPSQMGVLVSEMPNGFAGWFNRSAHVDIDLYYGGLSSQPEISVLNGNNRIAIQSSNGVWEIAAFAMAEEIAPQRWRLSNLLRGLAGTEDAMLAGASAGAKVVVLNASIQPMGLTEAERGLSLNWIVEGIGLAAPPVGPLVFAGGVRSLTPLAPVHLHAKRDENDDIHISWIRRSRTDADNWEAYDIPLDEAEERYRVDILDGEKPIRTTDVQQPSFTYTNLNEIEDFGSMQTAISVRVRQIGRVVPLGLAARKSMPV